MSAKHDLAIRRKSRLRYQIKQKAHGRPRLSVFRSGKNMYAQALLERFIDVLLLKI